MSTNPSYKHKMLTTLIIFLLIFSTSTFLLNITPVKAASSTEFIQQVQPGSYLQYEEEIYIDWNDWDWTNYKVGEATRRTTITEVTEKGFTIREDITYKMYLQTNLDYFYVDLETLDGEREELEGSTRDSTTATSITTSIHALYKVEKDSGKVLEYILGGVNDEEETDQTNQIPQEIEHYWSYLTAENTQEYAWDVVGFPYKDTPWGYSVQPNMEEGKQFDNNKWTVKDPISLGFEGQAHESMNITGKWKDQTDDETLAEWTSEKICDKDTGIKLIQKWTGNCKVQVYDLASLKWSLKDGFEIAVFQKLTYTNIQLTAQEKPYPTIKILTPNQGAFLGGKVTVKAQINNTIHDAEINKLFYYAKSSTSTTWFTLHSTVIEETSDIWSDQLEIDISTWTGKWQIKVEGQSYSNFDITKEYYDIVDVFLKPLYIDNLEITNLKQTDFGPHKEGGLDRIPYQVSFDLITRDDLIGNPTILIDCWYLPLTGSYWSEELGETINLEDYWGGDPAYQALFKALYAEKSTETDPIIGSQKIIRKYFEDIPPGRVDGGSYNNHGYNYTIPNESGTPQKGSIDNNKPTTITLKKGETANFNFGLYFNNPGSESKPKIRLFSFEVLVDYQINFEGEKQSFTEQVQKSIAVRRLEPIVTPYDAFIDQISQVFSPNFIIGYNIEQAFGKEYAQAAYQGNYVRYLYYLAMGLDFTIRNTPNALSYFGILTGPYWAAVVGTISIATGIPLPTSWLDLVTEISARAYASVPKKDRIGIWYVLLQAATGLQEQTKIFDPKPIVEWANIISTSGEGELLNTTLTLQIKTYEKSDNKYYLDFNITNNGDYKARFITVYIKGETWVPSTRHTFVQTSINPGQPLRGEEYYIGSKNGKYRFDVYFISKPGQSTPPVHSITEENMISPPDTQFVVPIISQTITAFSPVNLRMYNQNNNQVGTNSNGNTVLEIPGSWYTGANSSPEAIILSESYPQTKLEVEGTETGTYKLNFQNLMTLTNSQGEKTTVMTFFTLNKVKIEKGEKHSYSYNFTQIEQQINQLTISGWNTQEAIQHIFSNIDTDQDGTPDITDQDPFQKTTSTDLTPIAIIAGVAIVSLVGLYYYRKIKKTKYNIKKLDEF